MINNVNNGMRQSVDLQSVANDRTGKPSKGSSRQENVPTPGAALSGAIAHMVKQGMPIDMDRIAAVRSAIANGDYPVDSMKIAQKILEFESPGTSRP